MALATLILGVALGAACAWLVLRAQIAAADARLEAARQQRDVVEAAKQDLANVFKAQSAESASSLLELARSQLIQPIRESLEKVDGQVRSLEQARQQAYGALSQQLRTLAEGQEKLRSTTGSLATALRTPHVRGRWGETQLKQVVEATGLVEHCDFVLQSTTRDGEGALLRPDLVVRLPGGKQVVVDAKVPLAAYLDAFEADDDDDRRVALLRDHARQVRDHVGKLAAKAYWRQFEPAPDFVIMFLPDEAFLRAAQEQDSTIVEHAWSSHVIPASPTNLFALLRTVAAIWQQETVAASAREVHGLGQELYERLATLAAHFQGLGRSLTSAVGHYNKTVGTLETRVLVTGRRLSEHGIAGELPELAAIEVQPRPLTAPELVEAADAAPRALDAA